MGASITSFIFCLLVHYRSTLLISSSCSLRNHNFCTVIILFLFFSPTVFLFEENKTLLYKKFSSLFHYFVNKNTIFEIIHYINIFPLQDIQPLAYINQYINIPLSLYRQEKQIKIFHHLASLKFTAR